MARLACALAFLSLVCALCQGNGIYFAMGLGGFSWALGRSVYRQQTTSGWRRLWGALAMTMAAVAILLSCTRYALTWWALAKLEALLT